MRISFMDINQERNLEQIITYKFASTNGIIEPLLTVGFIHTLESGYQ